MAFQLTSFYPNLPNDVETTATPSQLLLTPTALNARALTRLSTISNLCKRSWASLSQYELHASPILCMFC